MKKIIVSFLFLLFSCDFVEDKPRKNPLDDKVNVDLSLNIPSIEGVDSLEFGTEFMFLAGDLVDKDSVAYNQFISSYIWTINGTEFETKTDTVVHVFNRLYKNTISLKALLSDDEVSLEKEYEVNVYPIVSTLTFISPAENAVFEYGERIPFEYRMVDDDGNDLITYSTTFSSDLEGNLSLSNDYYALNNFRAGKHMLKLRLKLADGIWYEKSKFIDVNPIPISFEIVSPDENIYYKLNESIPVELKILSNGIPIDPTNIVWTYNNQTLIEEVKTFDLKNYLLNTENDINFEFSLEDKQTYEGNTQVKFKFVGDFINPYIGGDLQIFNNEMIRVGNSKVYKYDNYETYTEAIDLKANTYDTKVNNNVLATTYYHYIYGYQRTRYNPNIYIYDENLTMLFNYKVFKSESNYVTSLYNLSYHKLYDVFRFDDKVGFFMYTPAYDYDIIYYLFEEDGTLISETKIDQFFRTPDDRQYLYNSNSIIHTDNAFYIHSDDQFIKINEDASLAFIRSDNVNGQHSKLYDNSPSQRILSIENYGILSVFDYDGNLVNTINTYDNNLIDNIPLFHNDKFLIYTNSRLNYYDMNLNLIFSKELTDFYHSKIKIFDNMIYIVGSIASKISEQFEKRYWGGQIYAFDFNGTEIFSKAINTRYKESFNEIFIIDDEIVIYGNTSLNNSKIWKIKLDLNANILNYN